MRYIKGYIETVKNFILHPKKQFSKKKKSKSIDLPYLFTGAIIFSILSALSSIVLLDNVAASLGQPAYLLLTAGLISSLLFMFIQVIIWGLWVHLWAYLLGADKGLRKTVNAVVYAFTPNYIIGWIPFVNIVASIWSWILMAMGLKRMQKLSDKKAIAAVAISIIIPLAIVGILALVAFSMMGTSLQTAIPSDFTSV